MNESEQDFFRTSGGEKPSDIVDSPAEEKDVKTDASEAAGGAGNPDQQRAASEKRAEKIRRSTRHVGKVALRFVNRFSHDVVKKIPVINRGLEPQPTRGETGLADTVTPSPGTQINPQPESLGGDVGKNSDKANQEKAADHISPEAAEEPPPPSAETVSESDEQDQENENSAADEDTPDNEFGLSDEILEQAREHHLSPETVKKAFDAGFENPIDLLVNARKDSQKQKRWETLLGIDLTPVKEPEPDNNAEATTDESDNSAGAVENPHEALNRQGQMHGEAIVQITKEVGDAPRKARRRLKRLAPPIPIVRNLRNRALARRMFEYHKASRPEKNKDGEKILYDDGFWGLGIAKKRKYRKFIKRIETGMAIARGSLNIFSRHELKDLESDRVNLAERILALTSIAADIREGRTVPEDFYDHKRFSDLVKKYEKSLKQEP